MNPFAADRDTVYVYDGAFDGFLSAVYDIYALKKAPKDIVSSSDAMQTGFGFEYYYVESSEEKARRVIDGLEKIDASLSGHVILAFLSWTPGRELAIYRYIALAFRVRERILLKLDDPDVVKVLGMAGQTGGEKNKIKGFLRFSIMENDVFYADISPKNNVLTLIMPHFVRRMPTRAFLINDLTYKQAGLYDRRDWYIRSSAGLTLPNLRSDEEKYRRMWKLFYDTTAVEGRLHGVARKQTMPRRYHRHITELQERCRQTDP